MSTTRTVLVGWPLIVAIPPLFGVVGGVALSLCLAFGRTDTYPITALLVPIVVVIGVVQGGATGVVASGTGLLFVLIARTRVGQARIASVGAFVGAIGALALVRVFLVPDLGNFLPLIIPWTASGAVLLWILLARDSRSRGRRE